MPKIYYNSWFLILLCAQMVSALIAITTDIFVFKIGIAPLGILILIIAYSKQFMKIADVWVVILAFVSSIIGDYYLSHMDADNTMFISGISCYLLAHIGYLIFSVLNGTMQWKFSIPFTIVFLIFYYFVFYPRIPDGYLASTVLFYLIVSCLSLGAALGIKAGNMVKWPFVIGITLILLSDTIIAFKEFVNDDTLNILILPTYYLAQICITIALYTKSAFLLNHNRPEV